MANEPGNIEKMHEDEGRRKIRQLERKLQATQDNIEISEEIIDNTPSDAQRGKLTDKNTQRRRAAGAIRREIQDIEQTIKERDSEASV